MITNYVEHGNFKRSFAITIDAVILGVVVGQDAVLENEPALLPSANIVGPFEKIALHYYVLKLI